VNKGSPICDNANVQGFAPLVDFMENEVTGTELAELDRAACAELLPRDTGQAHTVLAVYEPDKAGTVKAGIGRFSAPFVWCADHGSRGSDDGNRLACGESPFDLTRMSAWWWGY